MPGNGRVATHGPLAVAVADPVRQALDVLRPRAGARPADATSPTASAFSASRTTPSPTSVMTCASGSGGRPSAASAAFRAAAMSGSECTSVPSRSKITSSKAHGRRGSYRRSAAQVNQLGHAPRVPLVPSTPRRYVYPSGFECRRPLERSPACPSIRWLRPRDTLAGARTGIRGVQQLGAPGDFPFTRGPHGTMYRGKPWTMRMFAGFGTPEDTNQRFKFLLAHGQTGLSTAFDMPTLMGYDPDHPLAAGRGRARGGVGRQPGRHAPAVRRHPARPGQHLDDHQRAGGGAAGVLRGAGRGAGHRSRPGCSGTIQNDMFKEFIAQKEWICGLRPHLRIIRDMLVHCTAAHAALEHHQRQRLPHPRGGGDGGAGAGVHARRRHRLRAAGPGGRPGRRRVRAAAVVLLGRAQRLLRGGGQAARRPPDVGAHHARPVRRQEPALVAAARARPDRRRVAGGAAAAEQRRPHHRCRRWPRCWAACSRCTPTASTRPTRCPPRTRPRWRCAPSRSSPRRSGIPAVADPAGRQLLRRDADRSDGGRGPASTWTEIDGLGGIVRAIEEGYPQREIAGSAYAQQRMVDAGERVVVGVNRYVTETRPDQAIPTLKIDHGPERDQIERLRALARPARRRRMPGGAGRGAARVRSGDRCGQHHGCRIERGEARRDAGGDLPGLPGRVRRAPRSRLAVRLQADSTEQ